MKIKEGLDGGRGVWNSLISKNLAHYSLSLKVRGSRPTSAVLCP